MVTHFPIKGLSVQSAIQQLYMFKIIVCFSAYKHSWQYTKYFALLFNKSTPSCCLYNQLTEVLQGMTASTENLYL